MNPEFKLTISNEEYNDEEIVNLVGNLKRHIEKHEDVKAVKFLELPPSGYEKGIGYIPILEILLGIMLTPDMIKFLLQWIATWPKKEESTTIIMTFGDKRIEWSGSLDDEEFQKVLDWFKTQTQYNWTG